MLYQCCFQEEKNIFQKILKKPTLYYAPSELSGYELKGKDLEFENFPEIEDKKIVKHQYTNFESGKMFSTNEGGMSFERIFH